MCKNAVEYSPQRYDVKRMSPSWATDTASVPSGFQIRPKVKARLPIIRGHSHSYSIHWSAEKCE